MSIQTAPLKIVINRAQLNADTVTVAGGIVTIPGLPPFAAASVVAGSCYAVCPQACVPQAVTVTPTIPASTCECPWIWSIQIEKLPCITTNRVNESFPVWRLYEWANPSGAALTVADIVNNIVIAINADPESPVTAVNNGPGTSFTLTEKDCDSEYATCGFNAAIKSGTLTSPTAHQSAILSAAQVGREVPILPGHFLSRPELTYCGTYCRYYFEIDPVNIINDPHLMNARVARYLKVDILVDSSAPNFDADWATPLSGAIECLTLPASGSGSGSGSASGSS